jgi:hypothetical protein
MDKVLIFTDVVPTAGLRWRPRFRVTTMLWLAALIAMYFCGRRSGEIENGFNRWWQVTRVVWGADFDPNYRWVYYPRGSITINTEAPISGVRVTLSKKCKATITADRQLRVTPTENGDYSVVFRTPGRRTVHRLDVTFENGEFTDVSQTSR